MIYVECKPDEALVRYLTNLPKREVVHELKGKAGVCERVRRLRNCNALVDEDPNSIQPTYLNQISISEEFPQHGLKVFQDVSRNNCIVVLCPKLEDWILRAASDANLNMNSYNLPNAANTLHRIINDDMRRLERLLGDLMEASSPRLLKLKELLN